MSGEPADPAEGPAHNVEAALLRSFDAAGGARHRLERIVPGRRFLLAQVRSPCGQLLGGLASCRNEEIATWPEDGASAAGLIASRDPATAAIGLATINAVLNRGAAERDGVDWLIEAGRDHHVALIGRFPFIEDELRPVVRRLSVFEIHPRQGEYGPHEMARHLPGAEVVAITASTILNHTLDGVLGHRADGTRVLLLGPSTPLAPALFELGVELLAGIVVEDVQRVARDVAAGASFRQLSGTRRVSLHRSSPDRSSSDRSSPDRSSQARAAQPGD